MEFKVYSVVLKLVRKALNPDLTIEIPADTNWEEALDLAISQGVLGVCFEAVEKLPAKAGNMVSISAPGRSHVPRSN